MDPAPAVSLEHIAAARSVIDPVFLDSPQFQNDALSDVVGAEIIVEVECVNPVRSFKGRGAAYFTHVHKASTPRPQTWTCASAGNFGQDWPTPLASTRSGSSSTPPTAANPFKVERMRQLGAEVRLVGDDFDAAKNACRQCASDEGRTFIGGRPRRRHHRGRGDTRVELLQWPEPFDAVLIPVGNGALIGGVGTWVKAHAPATLVIGTGAVAAPAMERSFREQKVVTTESVSTIADGVATRVPVPEAVTTMVEVTDDMLLVDDEAIRRAMTAIERDLGLKVEPAGRSLWPPPPRIVNGFAISVSQC